MKMLLLKNTLQKKTTNSKLFSKLIDSKNDVSIKFLREEEAWKRIVQWDALKQMRLAP